MHTGIGGATGLVTGGKKGAVAGALGALTSEVVAEVIKPPKLKDKQQLDSIGNKAKFMGAASAFLLKQDVNAAFQAGKLAIDNNFKLSNKEETKKKGSVQNKKELDEENELFDFDSIDGRSKYRARTFLDSGKNVERYSCLLYTSDAADD